MNEQPNLVTYAGEHLCFERLIADLSERFIDLENTQVDCEIEAAQKVDCEAMGGDRSTVALWVGGGKAFHVTSSLDNSGYEPGFKFKSHDKRSFSSKILRGEEVRY